MATLSQALTVALGHLGAGRLGLAAEIYRRVLVVERDHPEALHQLGLIAYQLGQGEVARAYLERAVARCPSEAQYHNDLGVVLKGQGQFDAAIGCYRKALALAPTRADVLVNLGSVLRILDRFEEAVACYRRAIALQPECAAAHSNLGRLLLDQHHIAEAETCCRRAIALRPEFAEAHTNLANALQKQGRVDEAVASYRGALELNPALAETHANLGHALREQGAVAEAIACYRRSLQCRPNAPALHSQLIYSMHYCPEYSAEQIYDAARQWDQQHARPLAPFIRPHTNERSVERRLRVGYVSPDFYAHVVALNLLPVLREHDRRQFEVFGYSAAETADGMTERVRACTDAWRDIARLRPQQAADLIRQDRIDILVDTALHTHGDQLLTFACKPAPVQVTFAGYPGTTGLSTIDYRLTDPYLDPPGVERRCYAEESIRLPNTFWCYEPVHDGPELTPPPALKNGYVTFGRLSSFSKVNAGVLGLWASVLQRVDGSRLMTLAEPGRHRERTLAFFRARDVAAERITFVPQQSGRSYLEAYQQIDIGLDTFPYNGHTSSLDSFWMGVPVVTLAGNTAVSRGGLSILSNLQLTELAASSAEQYVQIAADLAGDVDRLAAIRAALRSRMKRSALMDARGFARHVEAAYRAMWRRWCCGER
jgi:predicted O-linked N-acetylglucosamine transferase (SPINDLY family)